MSVALLQLLTPCQTPTQPTSFRLCSSCQSHNHNSATSLTYITSEASCHNPSLVDSKGNTYDVDVVRPTT
eukprot:scaffold287245_cov30-Tisochrysis_lutea.AAC.1